MNKIKIVMKSVFFFLIMFFGKELNAQTTVKVVRLNGVSVGKAEIRTPQGVILKNYKSYSLRTDRNQSFGVSIYPADINEGTLICLDKMQSLGSTVKTVTFTVNEPVASRFPKVDNIALKGPIYITEKNIASCEYENK